MYDSAAAEFRMYYHGFSFSGVHQIGLATSPDGLTWTKHPGNPIVTPGSGAWDGQSVRVPMVWKEVGGYHMIYTGVGSSGMQVGYAVSSDGIAWTKYAGNPVFNDPTWAHDQTQNWGVIKVDSVYIMWYGDFGQRESGIAVSTDLVSWTPHQPGPVFATNGIPDDDRYSQYCPFSFKYGDDYYVLVPSYDIGSNYGKFYLYRSSSPYFPESDRHLVRVAHTVGSNGEWDDHDSCTPCVLTLGIERTSFYNDELWCYYSGEGGSDLWKEGLLVETDIAAALSDAPTTVEADFSWSTSGDVSVVDDPVHQGQRSVRQHDTSPSAATQLEGRFTGRETGAVAAWMRRDTTTFGDYDIYLYGGASLGCVAGLGRDGDFHYWNGEFQLTGVTWAADTWYLVSLTFDAPSSLYDFVVQSDSLSELVRVEGVSFGNPAPSIDQAMLYTSSGFLENGYADDIYIREWCGAELTATVGDEDTLSAVHEPDGLPAVCMLYQNYPNPFNPMTDIRYYLPRRCRVTLEIFDTAGRRIARLVDRDQDTGYRTVAWNGRDHRGRMVASGVYYYRLTAGEETISRKMVLLR
jgi:hypothetical protein